MPEGNQSRIQEMLSELIQLGVIKVIDIAEITPETFYNIQHLTLPTGVEEVEGVPNLVGSVLKQSVTVTGKGKLCLVTL